MQAVSLRPRLAILQNGPIRKSCGALRCSESVRAEGPRVTREYREGDDKIINTPSEAPAASEAKPNSAFIDDLPEIPRNEMSPEMKARLRQEYYSLGGSPNKPMGANWFLNISIVIAVLAVISGLLGYLG